MSDDTLIEGIDVSHYNGVINWKIALPKISFAYIKATEGSTKKDSRFAINYASMKNSGIMRGTYHFFRPACNTDEQIRNFLSVVTALEPGDLPPALDVEVDDDQDSSTIIAGVHHWLDEVQATLRRIPVIYTNAEFWNARLGGTAEFTGYPLWVAHYTPRSAPAIPKGFTDYTLWQYSNKGVIAGLNNDVDMNRFHGNLSDLKLLAEL